MSGIFRSDKDRLEQRLYHIEKAADLVGVTEWLSDAYERNLMFDFQIDEDDMAPENEMSVEDSDNMIVSIEKSENSCLKDFFPLVGHIYTTDLIRWD